MFSGCINTSPTSDLNTFMYQHTYQLGDDQCKVIQINYQWKVRHLKMLSHFFYNRRIVEEHENNLSSFLLKSIIQCSNIQIIYNYEPTKKKHIFIFNK
jgi:hypothetical protein